MSTHALLKVFWVAQCKNLYKCFLWDGCDFDRECFVYVGNLCGMLPSPGVCSVSLKLDQLRPASREQRLVRCSTFIFIKYGQCSVTEADNNSTWILSVFISPLEESH